MIDQQPGFFAALMMLLATLCGGMFALQEFAEPLAIPAPAVEPTPVPQIEVRILEPGEGYALDDLINDAVVVEEDTYSLNVWLQPQNPDADLGAAALIIAERLEPYHTSGVIEVQPGESLRIRTNATLESILPLISQVGLFEIVDMSAVAELPAENACILTTHQQENYSGQGLCPALAPGESAATLPDGEAYPSVIGGDVITHAAAMLDPNGFGAAQINITLDEAASAAFADFTAAHIGDPAALVIDGQVMMTPTIQARIEGEIVISGNFSVAEAEAITALLSQQPLPTAFTVVGIKTFPE